MTAADAIEPMEVDGGRRGLEQSQHHPRAGVSSGTPRSSVQERTRETQGATTPQAAPRAGEAIMTAADAIEPMEVDGGRRGLEQSQHHPRAGVSAGTLRSSMQERTKGTQSSNTSQSAGPSGRTEVQQNKKPSQLCQTAGWQRMAGLVAELKDATLGKAWSALVLAHGALPASSGDRSNCAPACPNPCLPTAAEIAKVVREQVRKTMQEELTAGKKDSPKPTWASVVEAGRPAQPADRTPTPAASVPKIVPKRQLRQILIKGNRISPEYANRSPADTVNAINRLGGKGGALAANKLPSGDVLLTFEERTKEWHAKNTAWVEAVFGNGQALAMRTYAVLAKGVHRNTLTERQMETLAGEISERNGVTVHKARAKLFKPGASYGALLLEFTNIHDANTLCANGAVWGSEFHDCEVYCGDLRPTLCYNCWQYGHKARFCNKRAVCPKCSMPKHADGAPCPTQNGSRPYFCPACRGPHGVFSKACPEGRRRWEEARAMYKNRPAFFKIGGVNPVPDNPLPVNRTENNKPAPEKRTACSPVPEDRIVKRGKPGRPSELTCAANQPGQQRIPPDFHARSRACDTSADPIDLIEPILTEGMASSALASSGWE